MSAAPQSFRVVWRGIGLTIKWVPEYFALDDGSYAIDHMEIEADNRAALPITETGYKSQFMQREAIEAEGGPVSYALAWLDHQAAKPAWKAREAVARQFALFRTKSGALRAATRRYPACNHTNEHRQATSLTAGFRHD